MPLPFDATVKELLATYPRDWLAQLGVASSNPVTPVEADLSTVTAQADKVLQIHDPQPWLLHLELQSSRDHFLTWRILKYNVLLHDRHRLPVHSAVFLLRPEADDPDLTGGLNYRTAEGRGGLDFRFQVVRVWRVPVDSILAGGLGTLPLAPLADVAPEALPAVIRRMDERLAGEAPPAVAATLWSAAYILMGLRYPPEVATQLLQGVRTMRESSTYQAILAEGRAEGIAEGRAEGIAEGRAEGRAEEARNLLLLIGGQRLGAPDAATRATIQSITDLNRLERLNALLNEASDWNDLLTRS